MKVDWRGLHLIKVFQSDASENFRDLRTSQLRRSCQKLRESWLREPHTGRAAFWQDRVLAPKVVPSSNDRGLSVPLKAKPRIPGKTPSGPFRQIRAIKCGNLGVGSHDSP